MYTGLLNQWLFIYKLHPTGLCDECSVPEMAEHFIMTCEGQAGLRADLRVTCADQGVTFTLSTALSNTQCQLDIYKYIKHMQRKI